MDPIEMLTQDHRKVEGLFDQYQSADSANKKEQIVQQVVKELSIHSMLEKEIFYPAVSLGDPDEKELVDHSYHDHAEVEERIGLLKTMTPGDSQYDTVFMELVQLVKEHAQEEEEEMFPSAREQMGEQLSAVGDKMAQRKKELQGISF